MGARTFMRAEQDGARSGWRRGQAAVESAIVLPMFVFIVLGLIQLTLMHQAKMMTKFAAYKAVRMGAIQSAKHSAMERAAMQVLLPMVVVSSAAGGEYHLVMPDAKGEDYKPLWNKLSRDITSEHHFFDASRPGNARQKRILDVVICNPTTATRGNHESFDSPFTTQTGGQAFGGTWARWDKNYLNVQVSFYYRLPIPFVNQILWYLARGDEASIVHAEEVLRLRRMNTATGATPDATAVPSDLSDNRKAMQISDFDTLAQAANPIFIIPLRGHYGMRLHSNVLGRRGNRGAALGADLPNDFKLPTSNNCL